MLTEKNAKKIPNYILEEIDFLYWDMRQGHARMVEAIAGGSEDRYQTILASYNRKRPENRRISYGEQEAVN